MRQNKLYANFLAKALTALRQQPSAKADGNEATSLINSLPLASANGVRN